MMKRIIALLLALILTVGLLPTVALAAEGNPTPDGGSTTMTDTKTSGVDSEGNKDNPVHIVKSVTTDEHGNGTLKLEAYVTDPMTIKTSDVPLDIVLVLDQSGSMGFCVNCGAEFANGKWNKKKCEYTQYVEVGLAKNLTSSSSNEQLYAFDSWYNSYDPVEYCDGTQHNIFTHSAGWYWKNYRHIRDNRIDSESKLYKKVTTKSDNHVHRLDTLTGVLGNFTKSVGDKATGTPNVKHRIAMVGFSSREYVESVLPFSSGYWEDYKNTEILTGVNKLSNSNEEEKNGNDYYYFPNGYTATNGVQKDKADKAGDTDYKNALVDVSQSAGQTSVAKAIKALTACGGTFTDDGLEMAQKIFKANPLTGENAGRKRIVILFTDDAVDEDHRQNAENTATALKNSGVTVYTIGLFKGANQTTNEGDNDFLQKVSSNNGVAPKQGEKSYYLSATNAASLQKVFEQITEEVNKLMLNVGTSTVLSDTLSEHFDFAIPEDSNLSNEVTFKLVPVDNKDADGNFTWKSTETILTDKTNPTRPTLTPSTTDPKSFTVTNFDYGANKITRVYDQTTGQITGYTGSKLVIEIPIKADTSCTSWDATKDTYPTNSSTNGAKLEYKDEKNNSRSTGVASPEAPVARYSVTYDHGTGSEKPAGVSMPTHTRAYIDGQTIEVMPASTAPDGYTFDGWYTDAGCTPTNKVDAENPPAIDKANCTLYGKFTKSVFAVDLAPNIKKQLTLNGGVTALPNPESFEITLQEYTTDGTTETNVGNTITAKTVAISSGESSFMVGDTGKLELSLSVGTHYFRVTETKGSTPNLTYADPQIVTVVVTANSDGTASADVTNGTITNIYNPGAAEFDLTGKFQKRLTSNTATLPTGANSFELKITGNNTVLTGTATVDTLDNSNIGTKSFTFKNAANDDVTKLTFTSTGTYTYKVQETAGSVAGMSYDSTEYTLTIVVDGTNGALTISSAKITKKDANDQDVVAVDDIKDHGPLTIENTFTAAELPLDPTVDPTTGEVTPKIVKELRVTGNGETAVDMTFNVSVKDKDGKEVATGSAEIKKGAKDKATANFTDLGTLVFPEAGDYTYTIKETKGNTNGVTYDEKTYTLKVKVTAANNVLTVTDAGFSYNNGTEEVSGNFLKAPITITNIYTEPTATVTKTTLTEETWDILPDDIKDNLEEYGYPQFPVKENDKLKLIVDKNVDKVKLAYVVAINGKAGSTVTISDPEADNTGEWSSAADGVDNRMVVFAFEDGVWTIQFKVDCTMKIFFIKTFNRNKTTGKFDTAINTVIANGSEIDSDPTTITDKDPGSFDFSEIIRKELKLTGSKSFTGAEFEATLKLTGIQHEHEDEVEINSLTAEYAHVEAWPLNWNYTLVAKFDENAVDGSTTLFLTSNGEHLLLDFPAAGTYTFELQETNKTSTNVTYDDTVYTVVVEVAADNQDSNKLVVTRIDALYTDEDGNVADKVIYISGETKSDVVTFVNTIDTGKDDYYPIIIPTIINKDTGMLNKTDHFAYVIGYPDGTVHPNGQITRAEVATIFFRLLRDEVRDGAFTTSNTYSDVAYGKWYNNPISTMSALGIITGYPDGTFKPNKPITRAEFAAIAARFDETQSGKSATFSDVIGHWAAKEIGIAYANEWIKGYPDGTFKPDQNITRAEAMTMINRVLERKPESPADLLTNMNKWTDNMDTSKWYYMDVQEATNSHGYTRKTFNYELWRQMLPDPDWSRYER